MKFRFIVSLVTLGIGAVNAGPPHKNSGPPEGVVMGKLVAPGFYQTDCAAELPLIVQALEDTKACAAAANNVILYDPVQVPEYAAYASGETTTDETKKGGGPPKRKLQSVCDCRCGTIFCIAYPWGCGCRRRRLGSPKELEFYDAMEKVHDDTEAVALSDEEERRLQSLETAITESLNECWKMAGKIAKESLSDQCDEALMSSVFYPEVKML